MPVLEARLVPLPTASADATALQILPWECQAPFLVVTATLGSLFQAALQLVAFSPLPCPSPLDSPIPEGLSDKQR